MLAGLLLIALALPLSSQEKKTAWPLSLADGLPRELPGYAPAPSDPLPDTDENDMGVFTEVSRFFQRIESPTVARQFRLVVQDYGKEKNLEPELRKAVAESARIPSVQAREVKVAGLTAFAVTDRSGPNPTTLVTVIVLPSRLVLAQGANVDRDAALKLLDYVNFPRIAATK
ncbi:MAG: hypothetical protein WEF99_10735 [Thermoanaerobaculia bacterium]